LSFEDLFSCDFLLRLLKKLEYLIRVFLFELAIFFVITNSLIVLSLKISFNLMTKQFSDHFRDIKLEYGNSNTVKLLLQRLQIKRVRIDS